MSETIIIIENYCYRFTGAHKYDERRTFRLIHLFKQHFHSTNQKHREKYEILWRIIQCVEVWRSFFVRTCINRNLFLPTKRQFLYFWFYTILIHRNWRIMTPTKCIFHCLFTYKCAVHIIIKRTVHYSFSFVCFYFVFVWLSKGIIKKGNSIKETNKKWKKKRNNFALEW